MSTETAQFHMLLIWLRWLLGWGPVGGVSPGTKPLPGPRKSLYGLPRRPLWSLHPQSPGNM